MNDLVHLSVHFHPPPFSHEYDSFAQKSARRLLTHT